MSEIAKTARPTIPILTLALLAFGGAGGLSAQQPGDQLRRTLPETEAGEKEDDRVFKNWIRLQRAGSASDRMNQRRRMIGHGKRFLPQLMSTLSRRNQLDLRQVLLVLLELRAEEAYDGLAALAAGRRGGRRTHRKRRGRRR